jgi:hypothetical protein
VCLGWIYSQSELDFVDWLERIFLRHKTSSQWEIAYARSAVPVGTSTSNYAQITTAHTVTACCVLDCLFSVGSIVIVNYHDKHNIIHSWKYSSRSPPIYCCFSGKTMFFYEFFSSAVRSSPSRSTGRYTINQILIEGDWMYLNEPWNPISHTIFTAISN